MTFSLLHVEPIGGVAGDMLLAALIDLGAEVARLEETFARFGEAGLALKVSRVALDGLSALHVAAVRGRPSFAPAGGDGRLSHPKHAAHAHHRLSDVLGLVERVGLAPRTRAHVHGIFRAIGEAEAHVHGGTPDDVPLHEVGELDSILDIVGVAVALESLGEPRLTCAALPSGHGTVKTSHGVLEVPVPAVVELVRRFAVPLEPVPLRGETITPTGVAVVAHYAEFASAPAQAPMRVGIGAGTRRFAERPNVVKVHAFP